MKNYIGNQFINKLKIADKEFNKIKPKLNLIKTVKNILITSYTVNIINQSNI